MSSVAYTILDLHVAEISQTGTSSYNDAYATDFPLNAKDVQRMFALGWFQTGGKVNNYDPYVEWSVLL
jgi:hypothetical protein